VLRLCFDVPGTVGGFRRWVLTAAPVAPGTRAASLPAPPAATALTAGDGKGATSTHFLDATPGPAGLAAPDERWGQAQEHGSEPSAGLAPGETKRAALIRLYERCGRDGDPRYGNRAKSAAMAGEIAGQIGYHPGTARRELAKYLAERSRAAPGPQSEIDMEAVA
jgi:hypothetical protein